LAELRADNLARTRSLRATHELCDRHNYIATASLIENWIDETERRSWFLSEIAAERWQSASSHAASPIISAKLRL
jgi:starvation-inducible DNA-binding protein